MQESSSPFLSYVSILHSISSSILPLAATSAAQDHFKIAVERGCQSNWNIRLIGSLICCKNLKISNGSMFCEEMLASSWKQCVMRHRSGPFDHDTPPPLHRLSFCTGLLPSTIPLDVLSCPFLHRVQMCMSVTRASKHALSSASCSLLVVQILSATCAAFGHEVSLNYASSWARVT